MTKVKAKKKVWVILGFSVLVLATTALTAVKKAPFPTPTGPYAVGTSQVELRDESRERKLLVQFYYPARGNGEASAPYTPNPEQLEADLNALYGVPRPLLRKITAAGVPVTPGAPPADTDEQFPLLLFSHGLNGSRYQNSFLLPELASQGYVIASIEHTGAASGTVLEDGSYGGIIPFDSIMLNEAFSTKMIEEWSADQRFVLDQIETLSRAGKLASGKLLDLEQAGVFGHSFGGATSAATLTLDTRFRAGINMDGFYFGEAHKTGFEQPFMELRADNKSAEEMSEKELKEWKFTREQYQNFLFDEWKKRIDSYARNGYESYAIRYANHMSFSDFSLMMPLGFLTAPHREAHHQLTTHLVLDFFNRHLKNAGAAEVPQGLIHYIKK
ncbi:MAG: prolyl oligopeptidase family serine peptidase [Lewinellaceae bacterium]|nr:prolyl oligopeptidase family serine peptidase [Lewinellaceae bacterium]